MALITANPIDDISYVIHALRPGFGKAGLSTARAVDADEVTAAVEATASAKRRVRVYSGHGFVPHSYKFRCEIQYVEATRCADGWRLSLGWTGAQRSSGSGNLRVVQ